MSRRILREVSILLLRVWDSSSAIVAWKVRAIWDSSFREKIASDSKKIPTGFFKAASSLAIPIVIMTFLAKRDTLLVMIRSILPALQSAIISLKASLCLSDVPLMPSSA